LAKNLQQLIAEARAEVSEIQPYEVMDLTERGEPFFLLDIRDKEELEEGTLPGFVHASRGTLEMRIAQQVPDPEAKVVLYCAGGVRSLFAARRLQEMGSGIMRQRSRISKNDLIILPRRCLPSKTP